MPWEINPGDIVCFHMLTLHAARGIIGGSRRRVFSLRFLGEDIVHAPKRGNVSCLISSVMAALNRDKSSVREDECRLIIVIRIRVLP